MGKSEFNKIPYWKIVLIGIVVISIVTVGFLFLKEWELTEGLFSETEFGSDTIRYEGVEYDRKQNIETFLVLGLDKFEGTSSADSYNNDKQADFLMLFVFDNDAKKYSAIHINRDTMVDVNVLGVAGNKINTVQQQIALSHTYGNGKDLSCHNTADSVSSMLMGMKVNHYASLTLDSVAVMNDLVGGVEVLVLDDFTGIDDTLQKGQTVKLHGEQALTYVRTRYGLEDSSNSTRMQRQRQYVKSLYAAFNGCMTADPNFIVEASLRMSEYMVSDRSVTQLQALAQKFGEYEFMGIETIEGVYNYENTFAEFYPNQEFVEKMIIKLFYDPKK